MLRKRKFKFRKGHGKVTNAVKRKEKKFQDDKDFDNMNLEEKLTKKLKKGRISLDYYNEMMAKTEPGYVPVGKADIKAILPNVNRTNF